MKKAFTLVEILVVVTIISLLASIGAVSYAASLRQSRDARRKTDLEQIRAALEMYRSYNSVYPSSASVVSGVSLVDPSPGTTVYLSKVPIDPKNPSFVYYYESLGSNGQDYQLCAFMESGGVNTSISCGDATCNYCLGPYGEK